MRAFRGVEFQDVGCTCPGRSWSFPATVTVVVADDTLAAHWEDDFGLTPCARDEDGFRRL